MLNNVVYMFFIYTLTKLCSCLDDGYYKLFYLAFVLDGKRPVNSAFVISAIYIYNRNRKYPVDNLLYCIWALMLGLVVGLEEVKHPNSHSISGSNKIRGTTNSHYLLQILRKFERLSTTYTIDTPRYRSYIYCPREQT